MTLEKLKTLCAYLDSPADMAPYLTPWRGSAPGSSPLILFPTTVQQVSDTVKACAAARIPIVPQGGNTGLVRGTLTSGEVIVNLSRMNKVREVDASGYTLTSEAGCILSTVQAEAEKHGRLFPLSMGSEGSCEIGGNLATNAGGINVLHYGTTRELCLGIEAVLADGSIHYGLTNLRKDNTGYDLKSLLIGSEGTLGIITAAVFKLFPLPTQVETALLAIPNAQAAQELLTLFRERSGDRITAFEYISAAALELVTKHIPGARNPLPASPAYLLVEFSTSEPGDSLCALAESALASAFERNLATDGVLAESLTHAKDFWKLRESISEAARSAGRGIHFDISVPVGKLAEFLTMADSKATALPGATLVTFGHFGDGNLHYNISLPKTLSDAEFHTREVKLKAIVYNAVAVCNGSISAEHGIGLLRKEDFVMTASPAKLAAIRAIKHALDPLNLLNPGKIF